jgi:hypothetical protein
MRELKRESPFPPVPSMASNSGLKKTRTARLAKDLVQPEDQIAPVCPPPATGSDAIAPALDTASNFNLPTDAVSETPKRRQRQPAPKAKPAASKAKKTSTTTLNKPNWDVSKQLILDRFRHLEQECTQIKTQAAELNQQSTAIQAEMEHLRTIAKQVTPVASPPPAIASSTYRLQPTGRRDVVAAEKFPVAAALAPDQLPQAIVPPVRLPVRSVSVPPVSSHLSSPVPPISDKLLAIAHSAYGTAPPAAHPPAAPVTRAHLRPPGQLPLWGQIGWRRLVRWWQTMPEARGAIAIDALALVFGAVTLRLGLQVFVNTLPGWGGLISLLILLPIASAIYLALFKPKANAVVIYRLVLITLGLVLGGKL